MCQYVCLFLGVAYCKALPGDHWQNATAHWTDLSTVGILFRAWVAKPYVSWLDGWSPIGLWIRAKWPKVQNKRSFSIKPLLCTERLNPLHAISLKHSPLPEWRVINWSWELFHFLGFVEIQKSPTAHMPSLLPCLLNLIEWEFSTCVTKWGPCSSVTARLLPYQPLINNYFSKGFVWNSS